jgi:S1-C subfamily serine protease
MTRRPGRVGMAGLVAMGGLVGLAGCSATAPSGGSATSFGPPVTAAPMVTLPPPSGTSAALAEARRFVFRVRNPACLATGTAFAYGGTIVTNRHVAAGATSLQLATWAGADFEARVDGHSGSEDLARLSAGLPAGSSPSPVSNAADPAVGTPVFVTGYPEGDQLTAVAGSVVGVSSDPAAGVSGPIIEVSDRVQPGNSGSPLLDSEGRVVGVVFAVDTTSGDGLAMPLSTLAGFLAAPAGTTALPCTS